MRAAHRKTSLAVVIGSRAFFSPAPCRQARDEVLAQLAGLGIDAVTLPFEATANGAVQSAADARLYAEHFKAHRDDIDGLVICLPNFGDEIAIAELVSRAGLGRADPVAGQQRRDRQGRRPFAPRRLLRQALGGQQFLAIRRPLHRDEPRTPSTSTARSSGAISTASPRTCRTVRGLRDARIGAIGARTGAVPDHALFRKAAAGLRHHRGHRRPLRDDRRRRRDPGRRRRDFRRRWSASGLRHASRPISSRTQIIKQAKWTLAVNRWIEANDCDASAIQCWRSLQDNWGCATCLTMSMMGEELMPSACEVDVMGAISMYALTLASGGARRHPRLEQQLRPRGRQVRVHPLRQLPQELHRRRRPRFPNSTCSAKRIGRAKCFGAVKGKVKAGADDLFPPVHATIAHGTLKAYLGEGAFTDDPFGMDGGIAVTEVAAAARADALHHPERLRAPRGDGARPACAGVSTRRSRAISAGRSITTAACRSRSLSCPNRF